jgi:prophage regulatory protein
MPLQLPSRSVNLQLTLGILLGYCQVCIPPRCPLLPTPHTRRPPRSAQSRTDCQYSLPFQSDTLHTGSRSEARCPSVHSEKHGRSPAPSRSVPQTAPRQNQTTESPKTERPVTRDLSESRLTNVSHPRRQLMPNKSPRPQEPAEGGASGTAGGLDDLSFLRLPDVKAVTGLSKTTLYAMIREKNFPAPVRLGPRSVAWVRAEVRRWAVERVHASRSAA